MASAHRPVRKMTLELVQELHREGRISKPQLSRWTDLYRLVESRREGGSVRIATFAAIGELIWDESAIGDDILLCKGKNRHSYADELEWDHPNFQTPDIYVSSYSMRRRRRECVICGTIRDEHLFWDNRVDPQGTRYERPEGYYQVRGRRLPPTTFANALAIRRFDRLTAEFWKVLDTASSLDNIVPLGTKKVVNGN